MDQQEDNGGDRLTEQETHEFLSQVKRYDWMLKVNEYRAEGLRASLYPTGIAYDADKVQTSPDADSRVNRVMEKLMHLANYERDLLEERESALSAVTAVVLTLDNPEHISVLLGFYTTHKTVNQMCRDFGFSKSVFFRRKKEAIALLSEKLTPLDTV